MKNIFRLVLFCFTVAVLLTGTCLAADKDKSEEKKPAKPPSLVEVAEVNKGDAEPMFEYVGSVYYARKSRVAAEVEGHRVSHTGFDHLLHSGGIENPKKSRISQTLGHHLRQHFGGVHGAAGGSVIVVV